MAPPSAAATPPTRPARTAHSLPGCGVVYKIDRTATSPSSINSRAVLTVPFPPPSSYSTNAGNLYGTARGGGITTDSPAHFIQGCGVVFKIDRDGSQSVLYSFKGGSDGFGVASGLLRDQAGNFYGTTVAGGISNTACTGAGPAGTCGVVYKLDPKGNETVLHAFTGGSDGYAPFGTLISDWQGNLFGAASTGGDISNSFCGTRRSRLSPARSAAELSSRSTTPATSPSFTPSKEKTAALSDGWLATDYWGNIYGITGNGGSAVSSTNLGNGTIFKIDRNGEESVLYNFAGGADGFTSNGSVILDSLGNLYGATYFGGDTTDPACSAVGGCGVVFRARPPGPLHRSAYLQRR